MKKLALYIKRIAPWIVATAIFGYLFHLYPPSKIRLALAHVNILAFALFATGYFAFIFIVDSWIMQRVISRFSRPVSLKDILYARGTTYLVMIINYPASQAAFAYYLKRRYGIAIFEALGVFLFIVFVDFLWIVTLALAGSFFQDFTIGNVALGHTVQMVAAAAYAFAVVWIAFWQRWPEKLLGRPVKISIIEKLRSRRVFRIFNQALPADYLKTALMRTPIHFTIIVSMYVVMLTFNCHIPFLKILGNVPLVFFIGTLPITPGGLGTTNAAMVELLSPYLTGPIFAAGDISPKDLLFTATILWMFANYSLKAICGTIFLKKVSSALISPTPDIPEEEVEDEASHIGGNL